MNIFRYFLNKLCIYISKEHDIIEENDIIEKNNIIEENNIIKNKHIIENNNNIYITTFSNNNILSFNESKKKNNIYYRNDIIKKNYNNITSNIYIDNNNLYLYKITYKKTISYNYLNILRYLNNNKIKNIIIPEDIYKNLDIYNTCYISKIKYKKYGDLFDYIVNNNIKYYYIYNIFYKISNIIYDLHKINISHRDLKPENFIIDYTPNFNIYLIDFEFSNYSNTHLDFRGGSLAYASPELLNKKEYIYDFRHIDIWAICVILYVLLFKKMPWEIALLKDSIHYTLYNNDNNYIIEDLWLLDIPNKHKILYKKILKSGLEINSNYRINIENILQLL